MNTKTTAIIGASMAILCSASSVRAAVFADPCSLLNETEVGTALGAPVTITKSGSDATHCAFVKALTTVRPNNVIRFASLSAVVMSGIVSCIWPLRATAQQGSRPLKPDDAVIAYCGAWNAVDRAERDRLLAEVWAPDGEYTDSNPTRTVGRAALSDTIAALQKRYPGARFRCSAPQTHHAYMRTTWVLRRPDKTEVARGEDFIERGDDGRIRRVTGFFGDAPAIKP